MPNDLSLNIVVAETGSLFVDLGLGQLDWSQGAARHTDPAFGLR